MKCKRRVPGLRSFRRAESGVSLIEFAFAAPFVIWLMAAIIEFGMVMFVTTLMEGGLRDASRFGITGQLPDGETREGAIRRIVEERGIGLIDMDKAVFTVKVYPDFGTAGQGEDYIDGNGNGQYDVGETFSDVNGNGARDADLGEDGPGEAGEVVLYEMEYPWEVLTPIATRLISADGVIPLRASVAVRNEPWELEGGA